MAGGSTYYTYKRDVPSGGSLAFRKGKGYYSKRSGPAGLSGGDSSLLKYLAGLASVPGGDIGKQATDYVSAETGPIIKQLTDALASYTERGSKAIGDVTGGWMTDVKGIPGQVAADYDQAAAGRSAAEGALGAFLNGQASGSYDELAGKLGAAGAPASAVSDVAGGVQSLGKNAADVSVASGHAGIDRILGDKGASLAYAHELPGIVALSGRAQLRDFSNEQSATLRDQLGQVRAQVPGLVADVTDRLSGRRQDAQQARASLLASFLSGSLDRETQQAIAAAGLGKDVAQNDVGNAIDWTQALGYKTDAQGNLVTDAQGNPIPTASTANNAAGDADARRKARADAVGNRSDAKLSVSQAVRAFAAAQAKPQFEQQEQPKLLRYDAQGRPLYKKKGGGVTNDPRLAETTSSKVRLPSPTYQQILALALKQPEVQQLASRYALKPAEIKQLVIEALAAAGLAPAATGSRVGVSPDSGAHPGAR